MQREDWVAMNLPIRMYDVVKKALNDDIHRYLERNYGKISKTTKPHQQKVYSCEQMLKLENSFFVFLATDGTMLSKLKSTWNAVKWGKFHGYDLLFLLFIILGAGYGYWEVSNGTVGKKVWWAYIARPSAS